MEIKINDELSINKVIDSDEDIVLTVKYAGYRGYPELTEVFLPKDEANVLIGHLTNLVNTGKTYEDEC